MIDILGMQIFVSVASYGSFSKAAARLQISPAKASMQIKRLEQELGVILFTRSTRQVRITEEGKIYEVAVRKILQAVSDADALVTKMGAATHGRLRIEAPISLVNHLILPVLADFSERFPEIKLEFIHSDRVYGATHPDCEIIIRLGPLADSSLIAHPLSEITVMTLASPAYLARHGVPAKPEDLNKHRCINFINSTTGMVQPWEFQRGTETITIVPKSGLGFNQGESRLAAALLGLGIYRGLSLGLEIFIVSKQLIPILADWDIMSPRIMIGYAGGGLLARRARCFVDFMLKRYPPSKKISFTPTRAKNDSQTASMKTTVHTKTKRSPW